MISVVVGDAILGAEKIPEVSKEDKDFCQGNWNGDPDDDKAAPSWIETDISARRMARERLFLMVGLD